MVYAYEYAYDEQDRLTAMFDYDIERKEECGSAFTAFPNKAS